MQGRFSLLVFVGVDGFDGLLPAGGVGRHVQGRGPAHGVGDDGLDLLLVVDGEGLVAGLEVEDAPAAHEAAAGAEHLSAGMPGDEDQVVRLGDEELLAVRLVVRHLEVVADALGDGMARARHPEALHVPVLAPAEHVRARAEQAGEGLGGVRGVQGDEAHAVVDALADLGYHLVGNLLVRHVSPPEQDVGVVQDLVRQAVLGLVQRGGAHGHVLVLGKEVGDGAVDAVGVDGRNLGHLLFVAELVPNSNANHGYPSSKDRISLLQYSGFCGKSIAGARGFFVDGGRRLAVSWEKRTRTGRQRDGNLAFRHVQI